jgi:hypothetical protein
LGKKGIEYFYGGGAEIQMSSERALKLDLRGLDRLSSVIIPYDTLKCKIRAYFGSMDIS